MSSPRTLVALATFNEIENLPSLVDEVLRVLPHAEVLVVDDNSPDGTGDWCDKHARHGYYAFIERGNSASARRCWQPRDLRSIAVMKSL
jgi:glycosyltransferase involved in cell wall biosynthesis